MNTKRDLGLLPCAAVAIAFAFAACSGGDSNGGSGGASSSGGTAGSGGTSNTGGSNGTGGSDTGVTSTGGTTTPDGSGGTAKSGGTSGSGGVRSGGAGGSCGSCTGGRDGTGGTPGGTGGDTPKGTGGAGKGTGGAGKGTGGSVGGSPGVDASAGGSGGGSPGVDATVGGSGGGGGSSCPAVSKLDNATFPTGKDPATIGKLGADYFKKNQLQQGILNYSGDGYAWTFGYVGSLQFTQLIGDTTNSKDMISKLNCSTFSGPPNNTTGKENVDNRAFGVLPLEIFLENGDTACKTLGMSRADAQYNNKGGDGLPVDVRYWIDDMYMITSLQVWAYRATKNTKYLELAAKTMIAYIAALQQDNPGSPVSGLFWHTKKSHAYWSRANGWVAAGATELLLELAPGTDRDKIMAGWKKHIEALVSDLQFPSGADEGCWHQVLDVTTNTASYAETSSSAMFTFALVTGLKNGWISGEKYTTAALAGWKCISTKTNSAGLLTKVCQGTGEPTATDLAGQQQFYFGRKTPDGDRHGQGPLLWAATALLRKDCPGLR